MWAKVGYSGSAVERWPIDRGDQGFSPPATNLKFGQFCYPTLPVSFGRNNKAVCPF